MGVVVACAVAAAAFLVVAIKEWVYRGDHPYALGPSGEIMALAAAGVVLSAVLGWLGWQWHQTEYLRRATQDRLSREYHERVYGPGAE